MECYTESYVGIGKPIDPAIQQIIKDLLIELLDEENKEIRCVVRPSIYPTEIIIEPIDGKIIKVSLEAAALEESKDIEVLDIIPAICMHLRYKGEHLITIHFESQGKRE